MNFNVRMSFFFLMSKEERVKFDLDYGRSLPSLNGNDRPSS